MKHTMKLNEKAFERIKKGTKIREYRVNDEKRQLVNVGDTIEFQKLPDLKEKIIVKVKEIEKFNSLEEAIKKYFESDFKDRHTSVEETVESFYKRGFYQKEEVQKYGCVVFHI